MATPLPRLQPGPYVATCFVSVPYRLRDGLFERVRYSPIWEPQTKRWQIRVSDESKIRAWLDEELSKPWSKKAA